VILLNELRPERGMGAVRHDQAWRRVLRVFGSGMVVGVVERAGGETGSVVS
jgi:hypothetical protein